MDGAGCYGPRLSNSGAFGMQVIDPAGTVRGELPAGSSFEQILAVAWGVKSRDRFLVTAEDTHQWSLTIYRPGSVPVDATPGRAIDLRGNPGQPRPDPSGHDRSGMARPR